LTTLLADITNYLDDQKEQKNKKNKSKESDQKKGIAMRKAAMETYGM